MSSDIRMVRASSAAQAAENGARTVVEVIRERRSPDAACHIAVAGGSTPAAMYRSIAEAIDDWSGVRIWLGDERHVPPISPQANAHIVMTTLLDRLNRSGPNPLELVHTALPVTQAAHDYADRLRGALPGDGPSPVLDLVILGVGEDGHTASLFPRDAHLEPVTSDPVVVPVIGAPRPPRERVSLTLQTINAARRRLILATGPAKREALIRLLDGERTVDWPITLVEPNGTELHTDQPI